MPTLRRRQPRSAVRNSLTLDAIAGRSAGSWLVAVHACRGNGRTDRQLRRQHLAVTSCGSWRRWSPHESGALSYWRRLAALQVARNVVALGQQVLSKQADICSRWVAYPTWYARGQTTPKSECDHISFEGLHTVAGGPEEVLRLSLAPRVTMSPRTLSLQRRTSLGTSPGCKTRRRGLL